jgi:outer membrane protein assembly factor BamB
MTSRWASLAAAALSIAVGASACGPKEKVIVIHPQRSDAAARLFDVAFTQQITLPDNFILRPDEFAAVAVDHRRKAIYIGSREGTLLALDDKTGGVLWEKEMGGAVSSLPVLASKSSSADASGDDLLLVGTDNGEMVAIDLDAREIVWRYQTDGKIRSPALVHEGVVFMVNSRDQVFALDIRTGDWRWQYEQEFQTDFTINGRAGLAFLPGTIGSGENPDEPGTLYTGFDNGRVVALGAGSGEALWIASVAPPEGGDFIDCDSTPLVDGERGEVIVSGQSTGIFSLSLADGSENWRYDVRAASSVVRGRGTDLVFSSSLEGVFALDHNGNHLWRTQVDPGVLSAPVRVDDVVYVTHSEKGLLAFDAETGDVLARIDLGSGMSSVPIYDPIGERFYATTNRGLLLALRIVPSWPEFDPIVEGPVLTDPSGVRSAD